jgi:BMFP domain-containing protein YqiC
MQTDNRLLDDLARMANGALNTLSGVREEIETRVRERVERMLADMDMVPREEFDAVKAMAQKAREEQEDLAAKVAVLERRLDEIAAAPPKKPATRRRTATSKSAG